MSTHLQGAECRSAWNVTVHSHPAGVLELDLTEAGYVWNWRQKPPHLVPLYGVLDDTPSSTKSPSRFWDAPYAMDYIMINSGFAYAGACNLEAIH